MSIRKGIKVFSLCLSLCLVLYPVSVVIADEEDPQEVTEQVEQSVEEAVVEEDAAAEEEAADEEVTEEVTAEEEATAEPESEPEETEASEDGEMSVSSDGEAVELDEEPEISVISNAAIQIDGSASDWDNIHMLSASDANCIGWAVAKDKNNYYFCMWGNSVPLWFDVVYDDGTQWNANAIQLTWDASAVKGGWYQDIPGSAAATGNGVTEFSVPADFFSNQDFTITYSGTSVTSADIPSADGSMPSIGGASGEDTDENIDTENPDEEDGEEETPVYNGIVIDSDFSDWAAVAKVSPASEAVDSAAMVFDGDYVYIYLSASINYAVAGAGSHGNGKYEIITDLGDRLIFQVNNKANNRYCVDNSLVSGVDGVKAAYSDQIWGLDKYEYEIAIPASALPAYNKTISFGLYLGETFIFDVANMQGGEGGVFGGIVYDGQYDDWKFYPHSEIEYATPGTHEDVVDGEGALYSEDGLLYGHVVTRMSPHLQEGGGEFAYAVTIRANSEYDFYPCLIAIDESGNINWSPQLTGLDYGTYEFYMVDAQSWHTAKTLSELQSGGPDKLFGHMYMTIGPSSDEMEFKVYIDKLAEKFGLNEDDIKMLSAQFGRIGQQWIHTAGTSSAPWTGLGVCFAAVGGTMFCRRRKNRGTAV